MDEPKSLGSRKSIRIGARHVLAKRHPPEEQANAYIAMLGTTAGLKGDVSNASIFDFSPAAEAAKEMNFKKWRQTISVVGKRRAPDAFKGKG